MQANGPLKVADRGRRYHRDVTLPRALSAAGRTLAVLGAVMLLFVAFELWGTGLQQARAQDNLEGDLAERLRQVAAAGQSAATRTTIGERDAGPVGDPAAVSPAPEPGAGDTAGAPPPPGDDEAPAGEDPTIAAGSADRAGATEGTRASGSAGAAQADPAIEDGPADPRAVPEDPSLPHVVRHISEAAEARSTARLLDPEVEALLPLVYPAAGEAIARLIIPAIDVDEIVVAGVEVEDLRKGPGHYGTTPLPGQPGNAAIAGHRTTYGAPFGGIAELAPGDEIIVETLQGTFVYQVLAGTRIAGRSLGHHIVAPTALEVLDDHGDNRLTLTSCHPKYSSRQRIIVHATLVGDPVVRLPRPGEPVGAEFVQLAAPEEPPDVADSTSAAAPDPDDAGNGGTPAPDDAAAAQAPTGEGDVPAVSEDSGTEPATRSDPAAGDAEDPAPSATAAASTPGAATPAPPPPTPVTEEGFGEGLSGDRGAIFPAVLWGLATVAVWVLGWAIGRSGRRLRAYAIAAVPFLVVLYVTFTYVDRALPAY